MTTLSTAKSSSISIVLVGLVLSAITLSSSEAAAAKVLNFENQPITATLSMAEISKAIIESGAGRGWKMKETAPGEITAKIIVRTHTATILVTYSPSSYSIVYQDSTNLKYKNGKIHRNYNKWIQFLKDDIDLALNF